MAEPLPPGGGFVFEKQNVGGAMPKEYIPGVEKGLESALGSGCSPGSGGRRSMARITTFDSSALAFEIAARMALHEAN